MDLHRHLHLVGINAESLQSGILYRPNDARSLHSATVKSGRVRSVGAPLELVVGCPRYLGIFMVRLDRADEE